MVRKSEAHCAAEQKLQQQAEWQQGSPRRHKAQLYTVKCSSEVLRKSHNALPLMPCSQLKCPRSNIASVPFMHGRYAFHPPGPLLNLAWKSVLKLVCQ